MGEAFAHQLIRRHLQPDVCSFCLAEFVSKCGSEWAARCLPRLANHLFLSNLWGSMQKHAPVVLKSELQ